MSKEGSQKYRKLHVEEERARIRRWRAKNPEKVRQDARKKLGILDPTGEQVIGACAICDVRTKLVYDHNHQTGKFRGWICSKCNLAMGLLDDDPLLLLAAIIYLLNRR